VEPRITLITLGVDDLPRAVAFYRDVVGWQPASVPDDDVAFFDLDGFILALWRNTSLAADLGVRDASRGRFEGVTLPTTRARTTRSMRSSRASANVARRS